MLGGKAICLTFGIDLISRRHHEPDDSPSYQQRAAVEGKWQAHPQAAERTADDRPHNVPEQECGSVVSRNPPAHMRRC